MEALHAFLHISGQWRIVCPGDGSVLRASLDYAAVRAGFDLAGIAMTPALWADIRMIEAGAIAAGQPEASA